MPRSSRLLVEREELRDTPAISNVRHLALVETARAAVGAAIAALGAGVTEELVLTDLAAARHALEEITGARTADDLLEHIFRFCVEDSVSWQEKSECGSQRSRT